MNDNQVPDQLGDLCRRCLSENMKHPYDCEGHCYTLIQQAFEGHSDKSWAQFYSAFSHLVEYWISYYCARYNVGHQLPHYFLNITFFRFWKSLNGNFSRIKDFQHAVNYLRNCAKSSVLDSVRNMPVEYEFNPETVADDPPDIEEFTKLWSIICVEIPDEDEQKLIYCYIVLDLKPQEILDTMRGVYADAQEIKVVWQRIRRKLRRSYAIRQWFGIDRPID